MTSSCRDNAGRYLRSGFKPARRGADRERVYEAPKTWKPNSKYGEWL